MPLNLNQTHKRDELLSRLRQKIPCKQCQGQGRIENAEGYCNACKGYGIDLSNPKVKTYFDRISGNQPWLSKEIKMFEHIGDNQFRLKNI